MTSAPSPPPSQPGAWGGWLALLAVCAIAAVAIFAGAESSPPSAAPQPDASATAPPAVDGDPLPADTLVEWREDETPEAERRYVSGDIAVTLAGQADEDFRRPVMTISGPAGLTTIVNGSARFGAAAAQLGVGQIDPASPHPQVLFVTYTGGAHCCADIKLLEVLDGAWRTVDVAVQDGGGLDAFPTDLDGDGKREFSLSDDRFLYAFDAYAASLSPPLIKSVERGLVRDVSAESRFRPVFEAFIPEARKHCEAGYNGACSAYVAASARVGRAGEAWAVMFKSYDRTSEWALPTACRGALQEGSCPEELRVKFSTYPEALRWFLGDLGYLPPVYIAMAGSNLPSFDCAKGGDENTNLICATAELAAADREMASLYWRALANTDQPDPVVQSQRAFLSTRDGAPSDAFTLLRLYQARITALAALSNG